MYIRMVKKQILNFISIIIILFLNIGLYSQESTIYLGEEDLWQNVQLTNLSLINGKRGFLDITNSDNEYKADRYSDIILSFNSEESYDITGNYKVINHVNYISSTDSLGGGAAFFDGSDPFIMESNQNGMFSPSTLWGDFSLEFRMLPATLREGSTIFLWKGLHMNEESLIPQEIRCTISNRRLIWDFENFFLSPDNVIERISLSGDKLIPGIWSHHLITFDSKTGLLEYRINNIPNDNVYTSKTGHESIEYNIPIIGNQQSFPIELGENYTGLIDEFRLSNKVIDFPVLRKYTASGFLETSVIDLKVPQSQLLRIESDSTMPANTSIRYQYAISNDKFELLNPDTNWIDFLPSESINEKGRFVKVRSYLYSEIATDSAPVLSNFKLIYKEARPPAPPMELIIEKTGENYLLSWKKSINPEIKGYLVYYGEEPGQYFSVSSPLDSGSDNSILLDKLDSNKRYYIAVTSYKSLTPRLESSFSREISISP